MKRIGDAIAWTCLVIGGLVLLMMWFPPPF